MARMTQEHERAVALAAQLAEDLEASLADAEAQRQRAEDLQKKLTALQARAQPTGPVVVNLVPGETFSGTAGWTADDAWMVLRDPHRLDPAGGDPEAVAGPLWLRSSQLVTVQPQPS